MRLDRCRDVVEGDMRTVGKAAQLGERISTQPWKERAGSRLKVQKVFSKVNVQRFLRQEPSSEKTGNTVRV